MEKGNHLTLVCGVVAPCYQIHVQGTTTPHEESLSPETTILCMSCVYIRVYR